MSGVTRWEVESDEPTGLGARYRMLMRVGSAEIGGLIEIVEWDPPRDLAWTSVTGIDQRGRWRLRAAPGGRTRVEFRLAYGVAGSGLGRLDRRADRRTRRRRAPAPQPSGSSRGWSSTSSMRELAAQRRAAKRQLTSLIGSAWSGGAEAEAHPRAAAESASQIRPPCASTIARETARPRPAPSPVRAASPRRGRRP